jgi:hypothetical protein
MLQYGSITQYYAIRETKTWRELDNAGVRLFGIVSQARSLLSVLHTKLIDSGLPVSRSKCRQRNPQFQEMSVFPANILAACKWNVLQRLAIGCPKELAVCTAMFRQERFVFGVKSCLSYEKRII